MKLKTRIILDWVELPFTLIWALFGKLNTDALKNLNQVKNIRKNTFPFKLIKNIIHKRLKHMKTVYFKDGSFIEVADGVTWEYENDENWSHTI